MNRKNWIILIVTVTSAIVYVVGCYFYSKWYNRQIRSHPVAYPYETYYGPPNPALMTTNRFQKDSLIKYNHDCDTGTGEVYINFDFKVLPMFEPVYILKYSDDSVLTRIYTDNIPGSLHKGWVYSKCLHPCPPDSTVYDSAAAKRYRSISRN